MASKKTEQPEGRPVDLGSIGPNPLADKPDKGKQARQIDEFDIEMTAEQWAVVQREGLFWFNEDGDAAKRQVIVLGDYGIEDTSGRYDDPNEALQKEGVVKLHLTRKRGA